MPLPLSWLPPAAVLVSAVAVVLIVASRHRPNLREGWTLAAAVAKFALVAALAPAVLDGSSPEFTILSLAPGVELALRADAPGLLFALTASALWILTAVYSIGYVRQLAERRQTRFFASFAACLSTAVGLAFSANLLTFLIFYELLTVATYPLVVHAESDTARAAGRRYLGYLLTGGVAVLLATALVYSATGTLEFAAGGFVAGDLAGAELGLLAALFTVGFGTKAAIMPLHSWLPAAMVAPTPVSALLHAVAVVKAGVFGFVRAFGYVIGPGVLADVGADVVVGALAAITVIGASLIALRQDNLKRRLAFSTVAHLSYIVLGLSLAGVTAWTGGLLHLANHAALKITLFFCAGALHAGPHLDAVSELDGVGRRLPVTMGAFALASAGLAGLPPMGGFVSKWFLVLGAFEVGRWPLAAALLLAGLLSAGYLFPVVHRAFRRPASVETAAPAPVPAGADVSDGGHEAGGAHDGHGAGKPSWLLVAPLAITALLGLVLGLGDLLQVGELAARAAGAVTGGGP
jgi:formate hydrogenlyase subunit 3/multisubunit Na+/H+ antiporter MnhD subunit